MTAPDRGEHNDGSYPVLVLHAAGLDASAAQFLDLPGMVAMTLPGHGARRPARAGLTLDDMVDEVLGWVHDPVHVIGLSLGGMVAQRLAVTYPERVHSLVLACVGADAPTQLLLERADATAASERDEMVETTMRRWFTAAALDDDPLTPPLSYARARLEAIDQAGYAEIWRAIAGHDSWDVLSRITAPTTCIAGSQDISTPPDVVRGLAAAIPSARYVEIEGPHMAALENPAVFNAALLEHLAWVRNAAPRVA